MNITAKPIVDGKFWIVEEDGEKVATLHKKENNKFMLSSKTGEATFNKKDDLIKRFGKDFFQSKNKNVSIDTQNNDVHTFPSASRPYNAIQFNKGWVKSFCPKLITVERYPYKGPYRTELELKQVLSNVKPD